jgi:hypothetical protein
MLAETDPARAKTMAQQLSEWLKGQVQNAAQVRQQGQPRQNPEADRLKREREALDQEKEQIYTDAKRTHVNAAVEKPLSALVDQYAKQYKLNDIQKARYRRSLEQDVIQEMNGDQTYKDQLDLREQRKGHTPQTVGDFIASEFNRRAKDKAFEVAKAIYGAPRGTPGPVPGTGQVKAGTPQSTPGGAPLKISARPADSQLDLTRPNADLLLIQGRGYLKDGRFVTWR